MSLDERGHGIGAVKGMRVGRHPKGYEFLEVLASLTQLVGFSRVGHRLSSVDYESSVLGRRLSVVVELPAHAVEHSVDKSHRFVATEGLGQL